MTSKARTRIASLILGLAATAGFGGVLAVSAILASVAGSGAGNTPWG